MEKQTIKEYISDYIDWLGRLGYEVEIYDRGENKQTVYLRYDVVITKGGNFQSVASCDDCNEVRYYLKGYVFAIIDSEYNATFNV